MCLENNLILQKEVQFLSNPSEKGDPKE